MFMLFALTLTTLAGLSTGLGGLVVLLFKRPRARMMAFSMGFAGGVMLTVSLSDMLPHTVETYSDTMGRFPAALASQLVRDGNADRSAAGAVHPR